MILDNASEAPLKLPAGPLRCLTATSADNGCGEWVVGVVVLAAEGVAQRVAGLALEASRDVGVDGGGDADVAEEFFDDREFNLPLHSTLRPTAPSTPRTTRPAPGRATLVP